MHRHKREADDGVAVRNGQIVRAVRHFCQAIRAADEEFAKPIAGRICKFKGNDVAFHESHAALIVQSVGVVVFDAADDFLKVNDNRIAFVSRSEIRIAAEFVQSGLGKVDNPHAVEIPTARNDFGRGFQLLSRQTFCFGNLQASAVLIRIDDVGSGFVLRRIQTSSEADRGVHEVVGCEAAVDIGGVAFGVGGIIHHARKVAVIEIEFSGNGAAVFFKFGEVQSADEAAEVVFESSASVDVGQAVAIVHRPVVSVNDKVAHDAARNAYTGEIAVADFHGAVRANVGKRAIVCRAHEAADVGFAGNGAALDGYVFKFRTDRNAGQSSDVGNEVTAHRVRRTFDNDVFERKIFEGSVFGSDEEACARVARSNRNGQIKNGVSVAVKGTDKGCACFCADRIKARNARKIDVGTEDEIFVPCRRKIFVEPLKVFRARQHVRIPRRARTGRQNRGRRAVVGGRKSNFTGGRIRTCRKNGGNNQECDHESCEFQKFFHKRYPFVYAD